MHSTIELSADQLANMVSLVFETNGIRASGISIYDGETQLGFNRVVVHCDLMKQIEVYPKPRRSASREEINDLLYPNGSIGNAQLSGAGNGAT